MFRNDKKRKSVLQNNHSKVHEKALFTSFVIDMLRNNSVTKVQEV